MNKKVKKICLSCKRYRIEDADKGICRLALKNNASEQSAGVAATHCCEQWADCGQTYYIRTGWLRQQEQKTELSM